MPEKSFFAKLFTNGETVEEILQYVSNKQIWTKNIRLASVFEDGKQWPKI
jgi:uroporphyrinogen-III synthase